MADRDSAQEARGERAVATALVVATAAALGLAVVYIGGGQPQAEGALLCLSLGAIGVALVLWAKRLLPEGEVTDERGDLPSTAEDVAVVEDTLAASDNAAGKAAAAGQDAAGHDTAAGHAADAAAGPGEAAATAAGPGEAADAGRGGVPDEDVTVFGRRRLLVRLLGAAGGALGLALLFPIRSLGPSPGTRLERTAWRKGRRLVDEEGRAVRVDTLQVGGILTVFPEGAEQAGDSQVILVRVEPDRLRPRRGREAWAPQGVVAYSKICTHVGCPVGLYQESTHELLCPCHQSTFDVLDGARPRFGPATRSLPQLPLTVDPAGFLVADGDFDEPVGPGYWNRE